MSTNLEQKARRVAKRVGLIARKSRWRQNSVDNYGDFMLVNQNNFIEAGHRFDMTAEEVIEYCQGETNES